MERKLDEIFNICQFIRSQFTEHPYMNRLRQHYAPQNRYFSTVFEQGTSLPHEEYCSTNLKPCPEHVEGSYHWPHLKHTMNPQLNNITDMLLEIIKRDSLEKQKEEILKHIETATSLITQLIEKGKIGEIENSSTTLEILKQLKDIINRLEQRTPLTKQDIEEILHPRIKTILPPFHIGEKTETDSSTSRFFLE